MTIERIRYLGNSFFFDSTRVKSYLYDKADLCHVIFYIVRDYGGVEYEAEWRIPGTSNRDILYARRMCLLLPPWRINRVTPSGKISFDSESTNGYTKQIEIFKEQ